MTFWLILRIAGEIAAMTGPMTLAECEARRVVISIAQPAGHEYRCQQGTIKWDDEYRRS